MSVIDDLKTYILTYSSLDSGAPVFVDFIGAEPVQYALKPLPGARIVETYLDGSTLREFPFAFEFAGSTASEVERMANNGDLEAFADWLESQYEAGTLPTLDAGKTAEKVEALGWGYLFQQGESQTAVYQVQCKLTYQQIAP